MEVIQGKSIFGGIAIGPIYFFTKEQKQVKRTKIEDAAAEIKRYEDACETAKEQLGELYEKALKEVGAVSYTHLICEDLTGQAEDAAKALGQKPENVIDYKTAAIAGSINEGQISLSKTTLEQYQVDSYSDLWQFFVVSLDQYNRVMGTKETLKEDEAMICTIKADYKDCLLYTSVPVLEHRGAILNTGDNTLTYREEKISLTKNEYRILLALMENKGKVVSRERLMERLWETDCFVDDLSLIHI